MRYFIIVGEPSGDVHAAWLMKALLEQDPSAEFAFFGGDEMTRVGGKPLVHIREMAFMGFTQLIGHLGQIRRNFNRARLEIRKFRPDVLLLVDYPGFNLRIARWMKGEGFTVYYYIPPKVWAWNTRRVRFLRKYTDRIFSILPFETGFFMKHGIKVDYVGNPVYEQVSNRSTSLPKVNRERSRQIALLPGSRAQEIERILPEMLALIPDFESYHFVVAGMEDHRPLYDKLIPVSDRIGVEFTGTMEVLNGSVAALVTSGTATLETALMGIPQVVCYKTNRLSYLIAKRLIKVRYISLVNLILDRAAVPELIQEQCNRTLLRDQLIQILPGGEKRSGQLDLPRQLEKELGSKRVAGRLSALIIKYLQDS